MAESLGNIEQFKDVDRLEVNDKQGRMYLKFDIKELRYTVSDKGKTLKLYVLEHDDGECLSCQ